MAPPTGEFVVSVRGVTQRYGKTVETAEERHNLTFRVKLQISNKEKLREYERMVKVGTPGMGYVQLDPSAEWPKDLHLRPPSEWPKLPEIASGTTGSKQ